MYKKIFFSLLVTIAFQANGMESDRFTKKEEGEQSVATDITEFHNKTENNYYLLFFDAAYRNINDKITGENFAKWDNGFVQLAPRGKVTITYPNQPDLFVKVWAHSNLVGQNKRYVMKFMWDKKANGTYEMIQGSCKYNSQLYPVMALYWKNKFITLQAKIQNEPNSLVEEIPLPSKEYLQITQHYDPKHYDPKKGNNPIFSIKKECPLNAPFNNIEKHDKSIRKVMESVRAKRMLQTIEVNMQRKSKYFTN